MKIDTVGPVTAAKAAHGKVGIALKLRYLVSDDLSPEAQRVKLVVKNAQGQVVKSFKLGTKAANTWLSENWMPTAKGSYAFSVYAKDLAGNAQTKVGRAKITVK